MPVYSMAAKKKSTPGGKPGNTVKKVAKKPQKKGTKNMVSNEGMVKGEGNEKPATIEFSEPAQWVERMALTSTKTLPVDLKADDDPRREEAFIQQALLSVSRGLSLLESAGVPWKRPADYYAEMFKGDVQMGRISAMMEKSKAAIEERAHRRAMKDQKKFGKEVQAEVLRQRAKYKREMGERITEWRHKRKGNDELQDILENGDDDANGNNAPGGRRFRKGGRLPQTKNLRPGGVKRQRPGKNARHRQ